MAEIRIGINGFGRIGRLVCRYVAELRNRGEQIRVVAINATRIVDYLAYQFRFDTVHGQYQGEVSFEKVKGQSYLIIDGMRILVSQCSSPSEIDWKGIGAEYICESTGRFTTFEAAKGHLEGGAKKVVLSSPPKSPEIPMYVMGVNHHQYSGEQIVSNASCTTNCIAPLAEIIHRRFGIEMGLMSTIHSMTASQLTVDGSSKGGKDWRSGRAASGNIIPASTGAAKAVGKVIPSLEGRLTGMAFRVPTLNVSAVDLTCVLRRDGGDGREDDRGSEGIVSLEKVLSAIREESHGPRYHGIVGVEDSPVVSSDFNGDSRSCVVDAKSCIELEKGGMIKIVAWYDNEWAYSQRLVELIKAVSKK